MINIFSRNSYRNCRLYWNRYFPKSRIFISAAAYKQLCR